MSLVRKDPIKHFPFLFFAARLRHKVSCVPLPCYECAGCGLVSMTLEEYLSITGYEAEG